MSIFNRLFGTSGAKAGKPEHVMLNYNDFLGLVSGAIVIKGNIRIALQDIGFDNMKRALGEAAYMDKALNE